MSIKTNPTLLQGEWNVGYALDCHTLKSVPIGVNPFGRTQYDTTRSEIGELLYRFKYKSDYDCLEPIVDAAVGLLDADPEMKDVKSVIPVLPTMRRDYQPVFEIAKALASKIGAYCPTDVLEKTSSFPAKSLSSYAGHDQKIEIVQRMQANYLHNILLVDDICKTGTTLNQCVRVLRKDPNIGKIFVLVITKAGSESL